MSDEKNRDDVSGMSFEQQLEYYKLGEFVFTHSGIDYPVWVVSQKLNTELPNFAGMFNSVLFISSSVPADYSLHICRHEVVCNIERAGQVGRCLLTTQEELAEIPEDIRLWYLTRRRTFYEALVKYMRTHGQDVSEILPTYKLVRSEQRAVVHALAQPIAAAHGLVAEFLGDIQSVGVQGDQRTYTDVMVLVGAHPGNDVIAAVVAELTSVLPISRCTYELARR